HRRVPGPVLPGPRHRAGDNRLVLPAHPVPESAAASRPRGSAGRTSIVDLDIPASPTASRDFALHEITLPVHDVSDGPAETFCEHSLELQTLLPQCLYHLSVLMEI